MIGADHHGANCSFAGTFDGSPIARRVTASAHSFSHLGGSDEKGTVASRDL
jgi:hypothetical protein